MLTEKSVTGASAWERLFDELVSAIAVELDGETTTLEGGLGAAARPTRIRSARPRGAVTAGARARACARAGYVFNTLLADKSIDDRMRKFGSSWIASRNLSNEASDESVQALVDAVQAPLLDPAALVRAEGEAPRRRPPRRLRPHGVDRGVGERVRLERGQGARARLVRVVLARSRRHRGATSSTSTWIDAPARPGKRPGAFCAYTVPSHHPYVLLNWTSRRRDVLTLAHELGHGLHAYLARDAGRVPPGDTAHAGRDRFGVRRDGHVRAVARRPVGSRRAAHAAGREPRGSDRDRVPSDRDEPLRARDAHRAPRGRGAVGRRLGELWADDADRDARRLGGGDRGLPHVVVVHPALHRDARLRVRVRVRPAARARRCTRAYEEEGSGFVPKLPRAAARGRFEVTRGARSASSASTSPIPASGTVASTSSNAGSRRPSRRRRPRGD